MYCTGAPVMMRVDNGVDRLSILLSDEGCVLRNRRREHQKRLSEWLRVDELASAPPQTLAFTRQSPCQLNVLVRSETWLGYTIC